MTVSVWASVEELNQKWQAIITKVEKRTWRIARLSGENAVSFAGGGEDDANHRSKGSSAESVGGVRINYN